MLSSLKFCGFLLIDFVVAVIGTAILDTAVRRMIPTHSVGAIVLKEIILSIVCAALIGFAMWRTWRHSAAKWTWVPAALWFAFGYLTLAVGTNVWGLFAFTVPLIRASSYSVGAYISSLMYSAPLAPEGFE